MSCDSEAFRWPKAVYWHLLFCPPNHEIRVAKVLQQRGFQVFVPSIIRPLARVRRWRPGDLRRAFGKGAWAPAPSPRTTYEQPIFPRYLFARFDRTERAQILDVGEIVMFDGEPASVTDVEIERIRELERELRNPKPRRRNQVVSIRIAGITLTGKAAGHNTVMLRKIAA